MGQFGGVRNTRKPQLTEKGNNRAESFPRKKRDGKMATEG